MKKIQSICLAAICVLALSSCSKDETPSFLEVNRNNISGYWMLSTWNGKALEEGSYFQMNLVRNDGTFTIVQNLDAFPDAPRQITGRYDLRNDDALGTIISGLYDHDSGYWSHEYVISSLTPTSMTWTAVDDRAFVQVFTRIDTWVF
ncbi:MAG: hypothetical protein ACI39U_01950 [Candidatus Cryptobacteroides sp.]